eukprot:1147362-Pelagomonas_calceolata.AAC.9
MWHEQKKSGEGTAQYSRISKDSSFQDFILDNPKPILWPAALAPDTYLRTCDGGLSNVAISLSDRSPTACCIP